MDLGNLFRPGMTFEDSFVVEEAHLAIQVGSGSTGVLSTPVLIRFMEKTAHIFLARSLPPGYSTVGTLVNIRHLAPTPPGATVHIRVEVLDIDRSKVAFSVLAWDDIGGVTEKISEGTHERFVIDEARFLKRVEEKQAKKKK